MSVQSTFGNQSLYAVENISAANCTSPIDGELPGEHDGDWTRITNWRDTETPVFSFDGQRFWTGGFRYNHPELDEVHEVTVHRLPSNLEHGPLQTHSETGVWLVHWQGTLPNDWHAKLGTEYYTTSLRDARQALATLLTNIPRANKKNKTWKQAVHATVKHIDLQTIDEYDEAHETALDQHTPWTEERLNIHHRTRLEWQNIREYRQRVFEELKEEVASDKERGYPITKVLPPHFENEPRLKQQFVNGELGIEEFEAAVEKAWKIRDSFPLTNTLQRVPKPRSNTRTNHPLNNRHTDTLNNRT